MAERPIDRAAMRRADAPLTPRLAEPPELRDPARHAALAAWLETLDDAAARAPAAMPVSSLAALHQRAEQGTRALHDLRGALDPAAQRAFDNAVQPVLTLLYEALNRCELLEAMTVNFPPIAAGGPSWC